VEISNRPIATVGVGIDCTIEINGTSKPIPLTSVFGVLEAHQIVDLRSANANLNSTFNFHKQRSVFKLILSNEIGQIHRVLISVVWMVAAHNSYCVGWGGSELEIACIIGGGEVGSIDHLWPII